MGVKHACISPGSRNTPLTIAFVEHDNILCHSIIDERSSGFFALEAAVDFHILQKYCNRKTSKAYKLAVKAKKKHNKGTRKVPKRLM